LEFRFFAGTKSCECWGSFFFKAQIEKGGSSGIDGRKDATQVPQKRKAGGTLRHSIYSLKRIARLSSNDRIEVLKILKKSERQRRRRVGVGQSSKGTTLVPSVEAISSASVNNDWQHWVAMQANNGVIEDDVLEVGQALKVTFGGDNANMFSVLAKADKGRQAPSVSAKGGASTAGMRC
jgi:hypothetical protein